MNNKELLKKPLVKQHNQFWK